MTVLRKPNGREVTTEGVRSSYRGSSRGITLDQSARGRLARLGLDAAQAILGHSSASTTERYAAPLPAAAIQAARDFG